MHLNYTAEACAMHAAFLFEKCRKELSGECKPCASLILERISLDALTKIYHFDGNPEWSRYIINLEDEIKPEVFSHDNPLYRHTPRIFRAGADSPVFGIEKLHRTHPFCEEYRHIVKQAVTFAAQQGIAISYQKKKPSESVYLIEERDELKVKFAYFSLKGGDANG